jgi:CRP-like cAMP-binding protein
VELKAEPIALEAPSAPAVSAKPAVGAAAARPSADSGGEYVLFDGDQPASAGFSLVEVDLGEPELPKAEAVVADSLAAAIEKSATGESAPAEAATSWFAPPVETPPESLAALGIATVDEDAEIEILTVSSDQPPSTDRLPEIPLFSDLSREAFVDLASRCALVRPEPGETIVHEGSIGTSFFVVSSGAVRVCKGETTVARLKEGSFFGEMALLSGAPRAASVIAEEETECLEISAALLADLQHRYPHVGQVLKKFARQRLLANVLATSPLFKPFDKKERNALVERFKSRDVQAGESVLEEGKLSDGLFVVMSGELEVRKGRDGDQIALASLKEGDVFGEISLLTKSGATATVVATRRSTVLRMPREAFDEVISTHPQVLMLVSELSDERLQVQQAVELGQADASEDGLMLI